MLRPRGLAIAVDYKICHESCEYDYIEKEKLDDMVLTIVEVRVIIQFA